MSNYPPCPVCGDPMVALVEPDRCPGCKMPSRVRALGMLLDREVAPWLSEHDIGALPVLAFAANKQEQQLLSSHFSEIRSASLYGNYRKGHDKGIDVRAMPGYADGSFSAAMGLLLFDYFTEHEQALAEIYRVLAPQGIFFIHIAAGRIKKDDSAPKSTRRIEARPGYFEYIPADHEMLNVVVGETWLLGAMARAGFEARQIRIWDAASHQATDWFVGRKRPDITPQETIADDDTATGPVSPPAPAQSAPAPADPLAVTLAESSDYDNPASRRGRITLLEPVSADGIATIAGERRFFIREVDPAFGFTRVELTLSTPRLPFAARQAMFGEHLPGSREIIGLCEGAVVVSEDLGESWRTIPLPEAAGVELHRCFTTGAGTRMLQSVARDADHEKGAVAPRLFRYTRDWTFAGEVAVGDHYWHGRAAIGQSGDTILWAEYPANKAKYIAGREHEGVAPRVWRSRDDGRTWEMVFEQPPQAIRHFHTCQPDPHVPDQWWLSSGDKPWECRVWLSRDDGDSWQDVTNPAPQVALPTNTVKHAQAVQRFTDVVIGENELIWGADDWLGSSKRIFAPTREERAGARMFRSPKSEPLQPEAIGWIGNPVRSIIDAGQAYVILTEAKCEELPEPQVYLLAKNGSDALVELCTIENVGPKGTGLSYSRASAKAVDGHFFSFRNSRDLTFSPARIMHWHIAFS